MNREVVPKTSPSKLSRSPSSASSRRVPVPPLIPKSANLKLKSINLDPSPSPLELSLPSAQTHKGLATGIDNPARALGPLKDDSKTFDAQLGSGHENKRLSESTVDIAESYDHRISNGKKSSETTVTDLKERGYNFDLELGPRVAAVPPTAAFNRGTGHSLLGKPISCSCVVSSLGPYQTCSDPSLIETHHHDDSSSNPLTKIRKLKNQAHQDLNPESSLDRLDLQENHQRERKALIKNLFEIFGRFIVYLKAFVLGLFIKSKSSTHDLSDSCEEERRYDGRNDEKDQGLNEKRGFDLEAGVSDPEIPPNRLNSGSELGDLEIKSFYFNSDPIGDLSYLIFRRVDLDGSPKIEADIVYLQDGTLSTSNIPAFVGSFLEAGFRVIVPQIQISQTGPKVCSPDNTDDVPKKTRIVAEVIRDVVRSDRSIEKRKNRTQKFGSKLKRTHRKSCSKSENENLTESGMIASAERSDEERQSSDLTLDQSSLFSDEFPEDQRPIFLIGLGNCSTIALSYQIETADSLNLPHRSDSNRELYSATSISKRSQQSSECFPNLFGGFKTPIGSLISGLARRPSRITKNDQIDPKEIEGEDAQRFEKTSDLIKETNPQDNFPKLSGIIAIGPNLDPNCAQNATSILQIISKSPNKTIDYGVESEANDLTFKKVENENLNLNPHRTRVPVLIAHGTKEAYDCTSGINSLYQSLSSAGCTLIFCPNLHHQGDLVEDAARSGLGKESLKWIKERIAQVQNKYKRGQNSPNSDESKGETMNPLRSTGTFQPIEISMPEERFDCVKRLSDEIRDSNPYSRRLSRLSSSFPVMISRAEDEEAFEELEEEKTFEAYLEFRSNGSMTINSRIESGEIKIVGKRLSSDLVSPPLNTQTF